MALLVGGHCIACCSPSLPGPQRLDGIAAVVNDDVVLESDVEEQLDLFMRRAQGAIRFGHCRTRFAGRS